MALIAVGVSGGIGAYKAVEIVRRLQDAGHDVVVAMTANARRFVGPLTFEAITRRPVITDQFRARRERDDRARRAGHRHPGPARGTGHRQHHRKARPRHRRRLPDLALPRYAGPGRPRPRHDNTNMYEHPGGRPPTSPSSRRAGRTWSPPARGISRAAGRARGGSPPSTTWSPPSSAGSGRTQATSRAGVSSSPPDRPGRISIRCASSATARAGGWGTRSPPRPSTAAPGWCWCRARAAWSPPAGAEVVAVRSAADMHAAVTGRADEADAVVMAAAVADYTPGRGAARAEDREGLRDPHPHPDAHRRRPAGARAPARRRAVGRCSSGSRPRPATSSRGPGPSSRPRGRTSSSPTTCRGATPGSTWRRTPPPWSRRAGRPTCPCSPSATWPAPSSTGCGTYWPATSRGARPRPTMSDP